MAYRDMPDLVVPPSHLRCEAMTKPVKNTYQTWLRESHRCVRRSTQSRAGRTVCSLHARIPEVKYWEGEPDTFRHKRFWRWPRKLSELAEAIIAKDEHNISRLGEAK